MLLKKDFLEIRNFLEQSQNPLFYFDDDQDGLCSFLLLRRFLGRGKGVPVKDNPIGKEYFRRVNEFKPDFIFILDKPEVSEDFFKEVEKFNLPVVWIDHHFVEGLNVPSFVNYYNSYSKGKNYGEPVTSICYKISNRKEDVWLAVVGCISDRFFPDFYFDFFKKYPDLGIKSQDAFGIYYGSEIGKISEILGTGLKDRTTNVMKMLRFLIEVKTPYEVLEESPGNFLMHKKYNEINKKFLSLVKKAKLEDEGKKVLFFKYSSEISITAKLANYFSYSFPERIVVVARIKDSEAILSIRGKSIKGKVLEILKKIKGSRGGGHEDAVGVMIPLKFLDVFKGYLEDLVGDNKA